MKTLIGLLLLAVSGINCAPIDSSTCIANYLKTKKLLSAKYGTDEEVSTACIATIKATEDITMLEVKMSLDENEELLGSTDCMIKALRDVHFIDYILKSQILNEKNEKVPDEERTKEMAITMHNITELTTDAMIDCHFSKEFGLIFDSILTGESSEEDLTDEEDYCVRKHILDKALIDKAKYKLIENPKSIDVSKVDCDKLYKDVEDKINKDIIEGMKEIDIDSDSTTDISDECVVEVVASTNTIDKLIYMDYLPEVSDKTDELKCEREKFIKIMKELTKGVLHECMKM